MKDIYRIFAFVMLGVLLFSNVNLKAGNDDRRGTAGAGSLLINPWAKSAGWGGVNTACGTGIDALFSNVAGLGRISGTEANFSYNNWLDNSGVGVSSVGLGQSLGDYGVIGLSVTSMSFGLNNRTGVNSPEFNNGTFSISNMNIGVSFAKAFSTSIYGGATLKVVNEGIDNVTATGVAIDAGIQYVTGENYEIKFGITLKNWGPSMSYSGDGLSVNAIYGGSGHSQSLEQRSQSYEIPSSLNIGASYDFLFSENQHRLTTAVNFSSMAFSKDQYTLGLEYAFAKIFMLRSSYTYEDAITTSVYNVDAGSTTLYSGFAAGASVIAPIQKAKNDKNGVNLSIDYAYRLTKIAGGIHTIGLVLSL
ncbi:MAG: PorV/PorQ family protein [Bacteroidales bacterium]